MAAETALPGCAGQFSAVRKPRMRVFGAEPPPVQPPAAHLVTAEHQLHDPAMPGVAPKESGRDAGGRSLQAARQPPPKVSADMQRHPEMPPVPLPRPMHLRIAGVALVPGRRRRRDDAALLQQAPHSAKWSPISRMASAPARGTPASGGSRDRRLIRNLFSLAPARRWTLSASQACSPSRVAGLQNGYPRCMRSVTGSGCGCRPLPPPLGQTDAMQASRRAQGSGHLSVPERSRGTSCGYVQGSQRSIAEVAACRDPPKERRGARQRARTGCTMPRPKSG